MILLYYNTVLFNILTIICNIRNVAGLPPKNGKNKQMYNVILDEQFLIVLTLTVN